MGEDDWFARCEDVPGGFDAVAAGVPADEADRLLDGGRAHRLSPGTEPVPVGAPAERRPLPDDVAHRPTGTEVLPADEDTGAG